MNKTKVLGNNRWRKPAKCTQPFSINPLIPSRTETEWSNNSFHSKLKNPFVLKQCTTFSILASQKFITSIFRQACDWRMHYHGFFLGGSLARWKPGKVLPLCRGSSNSNFWGFSGGLSSSSNSWTSNSIPAFRPRVRSRCLRERHTQREVLQTQITIRKFDQLTPLTHYNLARWQIQCYNMWQSF